MCVKCLCACNLDCVYGDNAHAVSFRMYYTTMYICVIVVSLLSIQHFQLIMQTFVLARFEPSLVFVSQVAAQALVRRC